MTSRHDPECVTAPERVIARFRANRGRHCERSEAIQNRRGLDCFVASLLATTHEP
jgi:hypothetical protein